MNIELITQEVDKIPITKKDGEKIIRVINKQHKKLNPFVKIFIPPTPKLLKMVPSYTKKYTVAELIRFLDAAHKKGRIP